MRSQPPSVFFRIGYVSLSFEYTHSGRATPLGHNSPRLIGCSFMPSTFTSLPSSTYAFIPQLLMHIIQSDLTTFWAIILILLINISSAYKDSLFSLSLL